MASNMRRAPALVPMNGMAGAGLTVGVVSVAIAVFLGFAFVPFAVMAVLFGSFAVLLSARGRGVAHTYQRESRIASVGLAVGGLAMVLGLLGVVLR
jgi:type III secretory pathway component EscV